MTTPKSTDDIAAAFPNRELTPIQGRPTFDLVFKLHSELKANAASVKSTLGGGAHGLLGLIMTPAAYQTLTNSAFVRPNEPALDPTVVHVNPTAAQIAQANRTHNLVIKTWNEMINTDKALTQQIIKAIEDDYITGASDINVGFLNTTTNDLLTYLYENYGNITIAQKKQNELELNRPWNPDVPIAALFRRVDKCLSYAELGNAAYTNQQVLDNVLYLIQRTGEFKEEVKSWRSQPEADKTWTLFKPFFLNAYQQYEEDRAASGEDQGYQAVNAVTEQLQTTIAELANATRSDQATMANLKTANDKLQADITTINDKLTKMAAKLNSVSQNLNNNNNNVGGNNRRGRGNGNRDANCTAYCHTHGRTYDPNHTSASCFYPGDGHQREAVLSNRMGGNSRGCNNQRGNQQA